MHSTEIQGVGIEREMSTVVLRKMSHAAGKQLAVDGVSESSGDCLWRSGGRYVPAILCVHLLQHCLQIVLLLVQKPAAFGNSQFHQKQCR